MRKKCAVCPETFEAKRAAAKYCSPRCRKRASRQHPVDEQQPRRTAPVADPPEVPAEDAPLGFGVLTATVDELEAAGRLDTATGRAAVALAARIEDRRSLMDTGSAYAALVRQHGATLASALDGAKRSDDALDELRARRERKNAS